MVSEKAFRSDLYYRLHVFPVTVPALRERPEDIPSLVRYFTKKYARQLNKPIRGVSKGVMTALCDYAWPGNIRELENVIERCVILSSDDTLALDRPLLETHSDAPSQPQATTLEDVERGHIRRALAESHWVISGPFGAAQKLGLKRTSLQYKMHKLGIVRPPSDPTV
jgi:formate hydrogenlyase transcriptional activator